MSGERRSENDSKGNEGLKPGRKHWGPLENRIQGNWNASSFSDRPSATRQSSSLHYSAQKTHGFASLPRGRFAISCDNRNQKIKTVNHGQRHLTSFDRRCQEI